MGLALFSELATQPLGGRRFGEFTLHRQIGRGGTGLVYEATKQGEDFRVAVKVLREEVSSSPIVLRRFTQEAEGVAGLHHPNIVPLYDIGEFEGQCYFSMKLIDGGSLDQLITSIGFRPEGAEHQRPQRAVQESIAALVATVARAVEYAHRQKIVHRDLKPANILLDRAGKPYLTDFGLAKFLEASGGMTLSNQPLGTPAYMSPEQAKGRHNEISGATDIYSLGIILYEMLTGRTPFHGVTPVETLLNVTTESAEDPRRLNRAVDRDLAIICLKCLEKDPGRRYVTAGAFADDLERWQRSERIAACPPGVGRRVKAWGQRHPVLATSVGFFVCLFVLVTVMLGRVVEEKKVVEEEKLVLTDRLKTTRAVVSRVQKFLSSSDDPFLQIESGEIASWIDEEVSPVDRGVTPLRLYFGVYNWVDAVKMIDRFAGVLHRLEGAMETDLGHPVQVAMRIYRSYELAQEAMVKGGAEGIDFARFGPASYVKVRRLDPGVSILTAENGLGGGYIFSRADSGVKDLADLKGGSFLFGDEHSTTGSYFPKQAMLEKGLTANDFKVVRYLGGHDKVVAEVALGHFDAGAANAAVVDELIRKGTNLVVIARYDLEVGKPWVARSGLDPTVAKSIRRGLMSITDASILIRLGNNTTGFAPKQSRDYDEVAEAMQKSLLFDGPGP